MAPRLVVTMALALAWALPAQTLTEQEAVRLALQHQPLLRAAQAEAGMAQARLDMARAQGALQFTLGALATASDMQSSIALPGPMPQAILRSQDRSSLDLGAMVMLPLSTGGRLRQQVRQAELAAAAAQNGAGASRVQVAYQARARYAQWQAALAAAAVAADTVAAQQKHREVAEQLFAAGKIPQFDLLRSQAALASAQQQAANAQAQVTAARARLAQALAVPADTLGAPDPAPPPPPPAGALEQALAHRPELAAAAQQIAAAEAGVKVRRASYRPQVYAVGMVEGMTPSPMGRSAGLAVGLVAGLPVLDGGQRRAEVAEARQGAAAARAQQEALELQVRAEVAEAEAMVAAARQNLDTAAAQIAAAQESYAVAQARYAAGKSTVVELLDALQALTAAQQSLVDAQAQYRLRLAELYHAMGVAEL